jgi:hypothetical protein
MSFNQEYPRSSGYQPQQTSNLATISLISGILTWVIVPIIGAIVAIITGHKAKNEIRDSNGQLTGDGMATAGLVLGYLQLVLGFIPVCIIIILALLGPAIGDVFSEILTQI